MLITVSPAPNVSPVAAFTASPSTGQLPLLVSFDASGSSDSDGTIVSYAWDFGDGNTASGLATTYTYTVPGTYTATLTVTDDSSATDQTSVLIMVDGASAARDILLVSGDPLDSGDQLVKTHLEGLGYQVSLVDDDTITTADANGRDLLYISATVSSGKIWEKFTHVSVPVVISDAFLWDQMGMTAGNGSYLNNQTNLSIVNSADPMAAGLVGSPLVSNDQRNFAYALPAASANVVAYINGSTTDAAIFAYETGDVMVNMVAPARRVGFYYENPTTVLSANANGWRLFDAAICWALNCDQVLTNILPTASIVAAPTSGTVPLVVNFDGTASTDPDGTLVSYVWDFGDGATGTGSVLSHTYTVPGTYTASLTVTDDSAATDVATVAITASPVLNIPPVAVITASPLTGPGPLTVNFDGSFSLDIDGTIVSYSWDFGDGNTFSGASPSHTYTIPGTYTATLTVTDDSSATDVSSLEISVFDPNATKEILFVCGDPTDAGDLSLVSSLEGFGHQVSLIDDDLVVSGDATGKDLLYISSTVSSGKVWRKFTNTIVPVVISAYNLWDQMGMTASNGAFVTNQTVVDIVNPSEPLAAGLAGSPAVALTPTNIAYGLPPATAKVIAYTSGSTSDAAIFSYETGDQMVGMTAPARRVAFFFENSVTVLSANTNAMSLFESAICWALDGCSPGGNEVPVANILTNPSSGVGPLLVSFNGSTSIDPDGVLVSYAWDFGDGNTGSGVAPVHTYATPGSYIATLTVTDDSSATDVSSVEINVFAPNAVKEILYITGSLTELSDLNLKTWLEGMGHQVTLIDDDDVTTGDATGKDLLYISGTVSSGKVWRKFTNTSVPVVLSAYNLWDQMGMTAANGTFVNNQTQLDIANPSDPLAAGLSGTLTVANSPTNIAYGLPPVSANVIAYTNGSTTNAAIFSYDTGDQMVGMTAPARRVAFFFENGVTVPAANATAMKLFESAICWALGQSCNTGARVIEQSFGMEVNVFPNPTQGYVQVEISQHLAENLELKVLNLLGAEILRIPLNSAEDQIIQKINLSSLASGVYILQVSSEVEVKNIRLQKM